MKKSLVIMLLALAAAVLVLQPLVNQRAEAAQGGQAAPTIKDPAEYNAYTNAYNQTNPAQKAQASSKAPTGVPQQASNCILVPVFLLAFRDGRRESVSRLFP